MNIEDLTIKQARELVAMFTSATSPVVAHPFVGKYAVCRCYSAGVHAGEVVSVDGDKVILRDSRRLWSWQAKQGVALSGVAQHGIKGGKIDAVNPEIYLTGVIEIIPCTVEAKASIQNG